MPPTATSHVLNVPGARLHYEVRGSGPVLLMIPGGAADSGMFAGIAPLLTDDRTVVTYDPRGLSRSAEGDDGRPIAVESQADDAVALLRELGDRPAEVFASSGGAITGLDLVARYPGAVSTLVAHEPPLTHLLPDSEEIDRHGAADLDVYRREGPMAAMLSFLRGIGILPPEGEGPSGPPDPEQQAGMAAMVANFDVFFGRMYDAIGAFRPDLEALRASDTRIVVAGGTTSGGQLAERSAVAFAEQFGTPVVRVPGDHGGFAGEPEAFATALREILRG